jgi:phage FluMu protein Com
MEAVKCPHCGKIFFDVGDVKCPFCKKYIRWNKGQEELMKTIFGDNFKDTFGGNL